MPTGLPARYEMDEDSIVGGITVPKGAYGGFTSVSESVNHPGGFRTTHWIVVDGDEIEITALVESGKANRI